jgi:prevent-host-death family protein
VGAGFDPWCHALFPTHPGISLRANLVIIYHQSNLMTSWRGIVPTEQTIGAAEFKAHCLEILDRLSAREVSRVTITKRGRPVAVLVPPDDPHDAVGRIHGFLRGSVVIPAGADLTAPTLDKPLDAVAGRLYR